ncbi:MAG TPA: flagellar assembly peptidoglycan hydrolase FlgJ [Burkholderiales bacterium]|jgi:flagellar protein FlgJ|nr:flagellar assembly peptidoglycan hydrolase FlgJ [Burkholderiales bacterium]
MAASTTGLALDPRGLERLRADAGASPEKSIKDASRQFETLFVNMLLKSMRDAAPQDGPLDSEQTRMYTGMLDQQLAQAMSARGIGLADVMAKQLLRGSGAAAAGVNAPALDPASILGGAARYPQTAPAAPAAPTGEAGAAAPVGATQKARDFINRMWPHAVDAAKATGLPPHFILGQAALESGWGSRDIKAKDGSTTHNLFGVKAGRSWDGETAAVKTTEFVNGVKQKVVDKFRQYSSYGDAFKDYANLLKNNPRFASVLQAGNDPAAFANGLQKAGYATDPAYAAKLQRIITGSVLRQGLSA